MTTTGKPRPIEMGLDTWQNWLFRLARKAEARCVACSAGSSWAGRLPRAQGRRDTGRAMSQEKVDVIRADYEAYMQDDLESLEAIMRDVLDPEVELHALFAERVFTGPDGMRE